jgi:hypothetical protein
VHNRDHAVHHHVGSALPTVSARLAPGSLHILCLEVVVVDGVDERVQACGRAGAEARPPPNGNKETDMKTTARRSVGD